MNIHSRVPTGRIFFSVSPMCFVSIGKDSLLSEGFMRRIRLILPFLLLLAFALSAGTQEPPQIARLGECKLESGQVIRDCRVAYRTAGALDAEKTNAILFPTWFTGRSANLVNLAGPGKMIDTTKFFVIFVDALGNGVSSSPSNSAEQAGAQFPVFTMRDMVHVQYRLVTEELKLKHLHAVMGMSMGGMQAFEWAASYPDFMDKVVSIVGTPQMTSYDLLLWQTQLKTIEDGLRAGGDPREALHTAALIHQLAIETPRRRAAQTKPSDFAEYFKGTQTRLAARMDPYDYIRQLQAMIAHDTAAGGSLEQAAAKMRAAVLVVASHDDLMVNPEPALRLANALKAQTLVLESDCGHLAFSCERQKVEPVVARFLAEPAMRR